MRRRLPSPKSLLKNHKTARRPTINYSIAFPVLLHWAAAGLFVVLAIVGATQHILPLTAFSVILFILTCVSRFWSNQSLKKITFELSLASHRAFPDEDIGVDLKLKNLKWLPVPWLEFQLEVPLRLADGILKPTTPYSKKRLRWATSISGGQEIEWKDKISCQARGDYIIGPVRLRSGDVFGLFPKEAVLPCSSNLLVYPKIVALDRFVMPLKELFGEKDVRKTIYDDMSRTMGTRDYRSGDPFRQMHWKASARRGELQVRQYESTSSLNLLLAFDSGSFNGQSEEIFEATVSMVASLAYKFVQEGNPVGLITNSIPEIHIPPSSGRDHIRLILVNLARINTQSRLPMQKELDSDLLQSSCTIAIIAFNVSPALTALARQLSGRGYSTLILAANKESITNVPGIPIISLKSLNGTSEPRVIKL